MDRDTLVALCLSLPGAVEEYPFGPDTTVFKTRANNRVFAILSADGSPVTSVTVKSHPEDARALRAHHPAITAGYHMNKKHWITVVLDGSVPDDLVEEIVSESHNLVRPKTPRAPAT